MNFGSVQVCRFALISLLSVFGLAASSTAQGYIFNQMAGWHGILNENASLEWSTAIAQGDFNGDGRLDFAVVDTFNPDCGGGLQQSCPYIEIYLAQSDGSYKISRSYPASWTSTIAVADVNGDGKLDLVYATGSSSNVIVVQLGNGDGTFQNPVYSTTPALNPQSVIVGDFNRDGKLDLALVDAGASYVYVQLGNGDGTFQAAVSYLLPGPNGTCAAAQVIAADFNNDNKLDLAIGCAYNGETGTDVLLGNGDGTFGPPTSYNVGADGIAAADMNKDGKMDLIVSGPPNGVSVLLGNGDGTFRAPISTVLLGENIGGNIVTGDFNGDGKMDVAMAGGWTGVVILLGNGKGGFKSPRHAYGNEELSAFSGLLAGDYNLDGKLDLAAASYFQNGESFSILTNNGDGTFGAEKDMIAGASPQGVVTADFNGDGKLDLAVTGFSSGGSAPILSVYLGQGNGSFLAPAAYPVGNSPQGVVAADFNHDGKIDLAVVNSSDNTVSILLNNGNGTFAPQVAYAVGATPTGIAVADVNKDGKLDLVLSESGDSNATVLLGNGDGTFQSATNANAGGTCSNIVVADFNKDGTPDLALNCSSVYPQTPVVEVLLGNGDGTFGAPTSLTLPGPILLQSLATADLRGTGFADLVVGILNQSGQFGFCAYCVLVYPGNGDGTFGSPIPNYGNGATVMTFADINGDGKLDAVYTGPNSFVGLSLGNGDGTFQPAMQYQVPHADANIYTTSVAVGDFNRDGSPDLAVTSGNVGPNGFLTIILSNPVAAFSAASLNFGTATVGTSSTLSLTVTDQSPTKLTIKSVTITGAAATDYSQTNTCGKKVVAYGNCTVTVKFKPSVTGARNATLNFADSALGKTRTVTLTGTGQ